MTPLQKAAYCIWWSLNPNENLGGRDDALMALQEFDYPFVQAFLEAFVCRSDEDEMLLDQAAESLWLIWERKNFRDDALVSKMAPAAQKYFAALHKS